MAWSWEQIAIGYFGYLTVVAFTGTRFARARMPAAGALAVCCLVLGAQAATWSPLRIHELTFASVVPMFVLLGGYWLSGLFFVSPMEGIERWLMAMDDRWLRRTGVLAAYANGPAIVHEALETAYVLVYAVIPAAVATLAIAGRSDAVPRYWSIVLLAEFLSYGVMPWLQTRPPRVLEAAKGMAPPDSAVRRLNAAILDRGSIQANTVPSGHAAGAVATALAVTDAVPSAGIVFLVLAAAIVAATVLGRYHYFVDSLLGIAVAVMAWGLLR
jgi:hypothetical protein